jgi:Bacterial regulatory proteins, luxR family
MLASCGAKLGIAIRCATSDIELIPSASPSSVISPSTTKTHLASLMSKLGARNRVELAMWTYETDRIVR